MRFPRHHRRGSALVLALIVSIFMTALVFALCWVAGEQTQRTAGLGKMDQAFYAAEAGAQRVQWYCKNNQMGAISSPLVGSVNGDNYSVTWSTVSGSTIKITSVGSTGNVSYTLSEQVTPPAAQQPVIESTGAFDNTNTVVTGNVVVGGNYTNGGNGSITGNLTYYGTASNTGSVSGTVIHASGTPPSINFTTLGATLAAAAGQTINASQKNMTYDFTKISGTNKVIYVNGSVSNPTFIGSGTLYVTGTIYSVGNCGSNGSPVNLVCPNSITTNNNVTIYGSIYAGSGWGRGGICNITGIIYTPAIILGSAGAPMPAGISTITPSAAPWFDPRTGGGGSGTTTITAFTGPKP